MRRVAIAGLLWACLAAPAAAQESAALLAVAPLDVPSAVLGETRKVIVSLPTGYAGTEERFPVLYLFDGDAHLAHTRATADFLVVNGYAPPLIVVAIRHADRTRDLTPTKVAAEDENSGNGLKFLQFLETELVPFIEARYRTLPFRVLCGHSFGGLIAMEFALQHPEMAKALVLVSAYASPPPISSRELVSWTSSADHPFHRALGTAIKIRIGRIFGRKTSGMVAMADEVSAVKTVARQAVGTSRTTINRCASATSGYARSASRPGR
jgi:S-formylglutathione hydrolase FrmB